MWGALAVGEPAVVHIGGQTVWCVGPVYGRWGLALMNFGVWVLADLEVVAHRSLSWRLTSEWLEAGITQTRALSMLDGGTAGLFRFAAVRSETEDVIRLIPMSASEVLRAVRLCLPTIPARSPAGDAP